MEFNLLSFGIFLFVIFDLFLVCWIFIRRRKSGLSSKDNAYLADQFARLEAACNVDPNRVVLDGDKLLDFALKKRGYTGSLGQKLKSANGVFSEVNQVWRAHKLRNRIAHEIFQIRPADAREALGIFRKAVRDLGADI